LFLLKYYDPKGQLYNTMVEVETVLEKNENVIIDK